MGTIFHDLTENYSGFGASKNNDKTWYKRAPQILVKTECFDAAGMEFVHIIVKHVFFAQFSRFLSSLCNQMTVQVQIHLKTLCF